LDRGYLAEHRAHVTHASRLSVSSVSWARSRLGGWNSGRAVLSSNSGAVAPWLRGCSSSRNQVRRR
jgi:hypothetical protein